MSISFSQTLHSRKTGGKKMERTAQELLDCTLEELEVEKFFEELGLELL
jgi:hypothetical protein